MREIVPECRALDSTPINEIAIDPRVRDDMSAVLKGLRRPSRAKMPSSVSRRRSALRVLASGPRHG